MCEGNGTRFIGRAELGWGVLKLIQTELQQLVTRDLYKYGVW